MNGIDKSRVRIVPYQYNSTPLVKGEVDATSDFTTNVPFAIRRAGAETKLDQSFSPERSSSLTGVKRPDASDRLDPACRRPKNGGFFIKLTATSVHDFVQRVLPR
jgi:hypothetical protein